jgi:hypothetical protein
LIKGTSTSRLGLLGQLDFQTLERLREITPPSVQPWRRFSAMSEFLSGYEASGWNGLAAPKSTSAEIIDKLNKE